MKEYFPAKKQFQPHQDDWNWDPRTKVNQTPKTLDSFFNDMFFLGFADQLQRWGALTSPNTAAKFPPYNLLKIDDDNYKVELAVAGYSKDDIDITVERDQLLVSSKETEEEEQEVIVYQGIAKRQWKQRFILGEYMEVASATLKDGLLTINVKRNLPDEAKPKVIKIK